MSRVGHRGGGVLPECRTAHDCHGILKIVMVPEIGEVASNLDLHILANRKLLHQAEVPILKRWSPERVAAEVAAACHRICQDSIWSERNGHDAGPIGWYRERAEIVSHRIELKDPIGVEVGTSGECRRQ